MKKTLYILFVLLGHFLFGQEALKGSTTLNELRLKKTTFGKTSIDAEKIASFPKGTHAFIKMLNDNLRYRKIISNLKKETCEITFVVDKEGSLINIQATGSNESFNKEAIRAFSKIKEKWIPSEINGEKVAYKFRLPLTINFTEKAAN